MNKPMPAPAASSPQVVIQKRSFGSSLVLGLFGTISVIVICTSAIAIYGISMLNDRVDSLLSMSPNALNAVLKWQDALPPVFADALDDRRAPEYRENIEVDVQLVDEGRHGMLTPLLEVKNLGDQMVTMMTVHVSVLDKRGVPRFEFNVFAATPVGVEGEWRGPLMPGSERRIRAGNVYQDTTDELDVANVRYEIVELRVWDATANLARREAASKLKTGEQPVRFMIPVDDDEASTTETESGHAEPDDAPVEVDTAGTNGTQPAGDIE